MTSCLQLSRFVVALTRSSPLSMVSFSVIVFGPEERQSSYYYLLLYQDVSRDLSGGGGIVSH